MKVRIKRAFRDRDTKTLMRVGEEAMYEQGRAKELAGWGFVLLLETAEEIIQVTESAIGEVEADPRKNEKEEIQQGNEKQEFTPFPEKSEEPKKRGRKPK